MHFRFTIRDLLWLMLVVGMALGWWMDRSNVARHDAESSRQAADFKSRYEALSECQNALDGLHKRHQQLAKSPTENAFELTRIERDILAYEATIEGLSKK